MATLSEHGLFWWNHEAVPPNYFAPVASVPGVLTISDNGRIRLELSGLLPTERGSPLDVLTQQGQRLPSVLIQGILKGHSRRALLSGIYKNGGHCSSNGISFEVYDAEFCLLADEILPSGNEPPSIERFSINLSGFEEWLRLGSLEYARTANSINISYNDISTDFYALDDGSVSIEFDIRGPYHGVYKRHEVQLKEMARLQRVPATTRDFSQIREEYAMLQDLLILMTDADPGLEWPQVKLLGLTGSGATLYFRRNKSKDKPPKWADCWTTYPELKPRFGEIYSTWLQKRREYGPAFYLYLGTRRGLSSLYVEHRFVNLIWGLESFHRRRHSTEATNEKLAPKIQRILGQVTNKSDSRWLAGKLKTAAEPALDARLFDILKTAPVTCDPQALRTFCRDCARLRNDISHFGGQREVGDYAEFMTALDKRSEVLSHLYHSLLLQEIGAADELKKGRVLRGKLPFGARHFMKEFGLIPPTQQP